MTDAHAMDPQAIRDRILEEHREKPHPEVGPGALKAHLLIHAMVEKQLAEDDPQETRAALERLLAQGHDRHEAIHLIGQVVAREVMAMMSEKREMDRTVFVAALAQLG